MRNSLEATFAIGILQMKFRRSEFMIISLLSQMKNALGAENQK